MPNRHIDAVIAAIDNLLDWQCGCGRWHERSDILARGVCSSCGRRPEAWDAPPPVDG